MSENETTETVAAREKEVSTASSVSNKTGAGKYIGAALVVSVMILGVLFLMEKEGRSSTHLFTSIISKTAVAEVNGEKITQADLAASVAQFKQMAVSQGVDVTSPEAMVEIKKQALDVLINTELLKQRASEKGLSITDEEVASRLEEIKVQVGGEEVLIARMTELGIDQNKLQQDIKDELLIQKLLDAVFAEKNIEITEEEILAAYNGAGGAEAGLPPIEDVRGEIESQLRSPKEQETVNDLLVELKSEADVQINDDESSEPVLAPAPEAAPAPELVPTQEADTEEVQD